MGLCKMRTLVSVYYEELIIMPDAQWQWRRQGERGNVPPPETPENFQRIENSSRLSQQ